MQHLTQAFRDGFHMGPSGNINLMSRDTIDLDILENLSLPSQQLSSAETILKICSLAAQIYRQGGSVLCTLSRSTQHCISAEPPESIRKIWDRKFLEIHAWCAVLGASGRRRCSSQHFCKRIFQMRTGQIRTRHWIEVLEWNEDCNHELCVVVVGGAETVSNVHENTVRLGEAQLGF